MAVGEDDKTDDYVTFSGIASNDELSASWTRPMKSGNCFAHLFFLPSLGKLRHSTSATIHTWRSARMESESRAAVETKPLLWDAQTAFRIPQD